MKSTLRRSERAVLRERRLYGEGTIDLLQRKVGSLVGSPVTLTVVLIGPKPKEKHIEACLR